MADEPVSTELEGTPKTEGEKKGVEFIPKKDYEDLTGKFTRIERLNQDLVSQSETFKQQISTLSEQLEAHNKAAKNSKIKGIKTPEEIQALLDDHIGQVTNQFTSKLTDAEKVIASQASQLKELQIVSKVQEAVQGRIKPDMFPFLKDKAMSELKIDPANPDKIIVQDSNGNNLLSNANPGQPMELIEWLSVSESKYPSMYEPKGVHAGTMGAGESRNQLGTTGKQYTREEWMKVRSTVTDRQERVRQDKLHGF